MGLFRNFPYTNFHELNDDWIIAEVKRLADEWLEYNDKWQQLYDDTANEINRLQTLVDNLTQYVEDYFANLDVYPYVSEKVDNLVNNGTVGTIILEKLTPVITQWLDTHITEPTGVVIDSSLSIEGACADAKATGDLGRVNRKQLKNNNFYDYIYNRTQNQRTYNGIVYSWEGENCNISGVATGFSFNNLLYSPDTMPTDLTEIVGKTLLCEYYDVDDTDRLPTSFLQVLCYSNGTNIKTTVLRKSMYIEIPSNTDGVVIRIGVLGNATVNEKVSMKLMSCENIDIYERINRPLKFTSTLTTGDLNTAPMNTIVVDTGSNENSPATGAGYVYTIGSSTATATQLWIGFSTGDIYYRAKTISQVWNPWILITSGGGGSDSFNPFATMLSMGNSILNGSVWINGSYARLAQYSNAPYGIIASALNIARENVTNEMHSSAGIIYDAGEGNFIENIMEHDISNIDVIVTHLWTGDMNTELGTQSSAAGMNTIIGAIKYLNNWIKTQNGNTQLVIIGVPPCSYTISGDQVFTGLYPNNKSIHEVNEALKTLANTLHFTFVDWEELNLSYYYQNFTDGNNVHANNENTYRIMGSYVAGRISSKITF